MLTVPLTVDDFNDEVQLVLVRLGMLVSLELPIPPGILVGLKNMLMLFYTIVTKVILESDL